MVSFKFSPIYFGGRKIGLALFELKYFIDKLFILFIDRTITLPLFGRKLKKFRC